MKDLLDYANAMTTTAVDAERCAREWAFVEWQAWNNVRHAMSQGTWVPNNFSTRPYGQASRFGARTMKA